MAEESDYSDAMCPICTLFLIEPVTLPCCHKELCKQCLDHACAESALTCPFCRVRIAVWVRKTRSIVNEKRWKELKKRYPEEVRRRLEGQDEPDGVNSASAPRVSLAQPGEIHQEYEEEKRRYQREQEEIRLAEEAASCQLIQQLQEEGKTLPPEAQLAIEERLRMDEELANRLVQEEQGALSDSKDPSKKKPASPTSASQGKMGPLDSFFEAMKHGSAQKAKGDSGHPADDWKTSSSPSTLGSKAPTSLAGPGKKVERTLLPAGATSKSSATATVSKAPSSSGSDSDSDVTELDDDEGVLLDLPDSPVKAGHHSSNVVSSVSASVSVVDQQAKMATSASKTGTASEVVVHSKPLFKPSSVPATFKSDPLKAAPSSQVKNGNGVIPASTITETLPVMASSHPPKATSGTQQRDRSMANAESMVAVTVSISRESCGPFFTSTASGSNSSSAHINFNGNASSSTNRPTVGILPTARSQSTGDSHTKLTSQVQFTQSQKRPLPATSVCSTNSSSSSGPSQVTVSSVQGTTTSTEAGRKTDNISGPSAPGQKRFLILSIPSLGAGSAAGMSGARDRIVTVTAATNFSGVTAAPSTSASTRPVLSPSSSPLDTVPHKAPTYKRTVSDNDNSSSLESPGCVHLTEEDDIDMESENASAADKKDTSLERSGDEWKPKNRISDLLGLHGKPTLPRPPACSAFPLDQPSAKPDRHPDLDLESSASIDSVETTDDEMDNNSNWSSSTRSTHSSRQTKDQDSLEDFEESGTAAGTSQASSRKTGEPGAARGKAKGRGDRVGRGQGKGKEETMSKRKRPGKRKPSPRPLPAAKKQKVDKNQPNLHQFFSRQCGSSSTKVGPSVEKSQEDKDLELAMELQKQFDIEARYRLTASRFKGADNEYSLRETRHNKK